MSINGLDLGMLTSKMSPEDMRQLGGAIDASLLASSLWPFIAMTFVVFFYCLGALYDERKDRSVLFWKSLPLSDRDTVLSKVASAVVVAPLIATAAALLTMFGFLLIASWSGDDARRQSRAAAVGTGQPADDRRPVRRGDSRCMRCGRCRPSAGCCCARHGRAASRSCGR